MEDLKPPVTAEQHPASRPKSSRFLLPFLLFPLLVLFDFSSFTPNQLAHDLFDTLKPLSKDPSQRALQLLRKQSIIDGHIDLPILARYIYANQIDDFDLNQHIKGQVDIPRLKKGRVGGFFWSVFVPCPEDEGYEQNQNFTKPSFRVRDTLEQIDVARLLIDRYSDTFELVSSARDWRDAMKRGKIGGMLGVEGGHQIGSSLSIFRIYQSLGVRYLTLTHTCNNALGDTCAGSELSNRWNGLSSFGRTAVKELNRLGMMVDISHVSPKTASDALSESKAPVIFSHSNARGVHSVARNVPDSILRRIGRIDSQREFNLSRDGEKGLGWGADNGEVNLPIPGGDAWIGLNFAPEFISEFPEGKGTRANVSLVADHADYIGKLAGRRHVGIGSDFDGILGTPEGLEDVSKYPSLITELIKRGWSDEEIVGLTGGNLLRVLEKVEKTAHKLRDLKPSTEIFEGRTDLKKHDQF
ncbi:hypothetical protein JCM5350_001506 [Sporobolomyces pararoseus]